MNYGIFFSMKWIAACNNIDRSYKHVRQKKADTENTYHKVFSIKLKTKLLKVSSAWRKSHEGFRMLNLGSGNEYVYFVNSQPAIYLGFVYISKYMLHFSEKYNLKKKS